jgi:hypothetical protein
VRSTAFTSVGLLIALPGLASAEGPAPGCYARDYDAAHLASHPEQVVSTMRLRIGEPGADGEAPAELRVVLSGQGRALSEGFSGRALTQALVCKDWGDGPACGVECDGGLFAVAEDAEGLTLTTDRLLVGDAEECGGSFDLVEREGEPVSYRLLRADPSACEGS